MKKFLNVLENLLPHAVIVSAALLFTCFVVDRFNRAMGFINNNITKWILAVFCLMAIALAVLYIVRQRKGKK